MNNRQRLATLVSRDNVMLALCTATTAAEIVNWRAGAPTKSNDGTICKGVRILFPVHTKAGRFIFRATLAAAALTFARHIEP